MAEVSATLVKQLRDKTGAGMNHCRNALLENGGDLKKAEEWLRAKGVKTETQGRATGEGALVARVSADGRTASAIEVRCETDFSARNAGFLGLGGKICDAILKAQPADIAAALKLPVEGAPSVESAIAQEINLGVRENVKLDWLENRKIDGAGRIGTYVHGNNKLAVLVGIQAPNDAAAKNPAFEQLAKDVAMHVAGCIPAAIAIDRAGVAKDLVDAERRVILAGLDQDPKDAKKPAQVKEKITEGKLGKFYKERCLLEQTFVKDESQTIDQLLAAVGKTIGGAPKVLWFTRRTLGGQ